MPNQTLLAYLNIRQQSGNQHMPSLASTGCDINAETVDADQLQRELDHATFQEGWVCYQSKVRTIHDSITALRVHDTECGQLLSAELASDNKSVHIRPASSQQYRLISIVENNAADHLLSQDLSYLAMPIDALKAPKSDSLKLNYRLFYKHDPDLGYRHYASRFTGFTGGES